MTDHSREMDDGVMLERLRSGDDAAFELLVRTWTGPFLRVARRFLRDEDEARDAVQDAFISIFRAIHRFEGSSRLSTWMHRIVINAALMRLRSRSRHEEESIEPWLPKYHEDGHRIGANPVWMATPSNVEERLALGELVRGSIDKLPESYRTVLLLRDVEELSTEETSQILGTTPGAVKVRLHRARQALRSLLDPHLMERGTR
ncbi:MAG: sigma-70 family RNA polymerase sigma factor [Thermoanaerobaculia bacterium]